MKTLKQLPLEEAHNYGTFLLARMILGNRPEINF